MTEAEWLACGDPTMMLHFLQGRAAYRKFHLFSCGCCRRVWNLLTPELLREVVELSESWADGSASETAVYTATQRATAYFNTNYMHRNALAYAAASYCGWLGSPPTAAEKVCLSLGQKRLSPIATPLPDEFFCQLVRDIFGNPFHQPQPLPSSVFRWTDGTVGRIAEAIYAERAFDRLPILADALLDAGCDDEQLMAHLRSPGPHVRGCWALDLVLGKE
jgi:hypothetical protein